MKKNLFNALATVLLISTISGCSKEPKDLLTAHDWKISSFLVQQGNNLAIDHYAISADCAKDNFTTFLENGTMILDEGAMKCDDADPQTREGTWHLNDSGENLIMVSGDSIVWTIVTLETDLLKTTATIIPTPTDSLTTIFTATWVTKD